MSQQCLAAVRPEWEIQNVRLTAHVGELLATALEVVAVLGLDGVLDGRGDGVVGTQNGALDKLDLTGHTTLETASGTSAGLLSLPPCFGRAGLAPLVW